MSTPLFAPLFEYIEANLHKKIRIEDAAHTIFLSPVHATRLFSFAYGITPAEYIRRRKLSESLHLLLETDRTVLEIALCLGFSHEQSFTRAFFAEFGMTPGKYRKEHQELPVLLPILDYGIPCGDEAGHLFGPKTVFLPKIHLLGVWHEIPYRNSAALAPKAALDFWENGRRGLPGGENATVFYGLTRHPDKDKNGRMTAKCSHYLTAIGVDADDPVQTGIFPATCDFHMPDSPAASRHGSLASNSAAVGHSPLAPNPAAVGYSFHASNPATASHSSHTPDSSAAHTPCTPDITPAADTFGGCPCIKFHYIGRHHYRELSQKTAQQMYRAIRKHIYSPDAIPMVDGSIHLEKIDASKTSDDYCLMEWYAPISAT